uniref:G-protein coupled receptors family 1 profile domain-containing protein n=1 Tax=Meloidogyne enterolobii TaxID=390850 RepID=A0A6V7XWK6_MELEN|nr:unnamed protein product [Meloidogyne enterolobii]
MYSLLQLYKQYKDSGTSSALILPAVMMNVAGIPGIAANLLLIFVTIQNNKLRGSANYLLALTAFFEILHQSAHFLFLFITVSGINFINYSTALKFQLHSIFGLTAAQTSMASIAADRLLSVLFPLKYYKLNIRLYFTIHIILAFISGIWMSINAINLSKKYSTLPVTGYISDLLVLDMEIIFHFIMLLCGINIWTVNQFAGILINIGASAETPILYIFSSFYREAINKQLKSIFYKKTNSKNVVSVHPVSFNNRGGFVSSEGINGKTKQLEIKNNGTV